MPLDQHRIHLADAGKGPLLDIDGAVVAEMGVGGEEKGSKAPAPKDMGVKAKNEPGIKSAKLETAPKATTSEKSAK